MVATALTRAAALRGSSAAADMPTGKPSAEPRPHSTTPIPASHVAGAKMTTNSPSPASMADTRSTGTRPNLSSRNTPPTRPAVMAVTKIPNTMAPVALSTPWPSTIASASQSFAEPSAKAMPSTITPMSRVRRSFQMASRDFQPLLPSAAPSDSVPDSPDVANGSGRRKRTDTSTAPTITAPTTARWTTIGTPNCSAAAPIPAPTMVPKLNEAWNSGITVRPSARSLAAPSTFMATSQMPLPRPNSVNPMTTSGVIVVVAPTPTMTIPRPAPVTLPAIVASEPNLAMTWLDRVNPTMAPTATPKTIKPISNVLAPNESRIAGVRAIQLARPMPESAKITKTALRHRTISLRVSATATRSDAGVPVSGMPLAMVIGKSSVVGATEQDCWDCAGTLLELRHELPGAFESFRSNRFDYDRPHGLGRSTLPADCGASQPQGSDISRIPHTVTDTAPHQRAKRPTLAQVAARAGVSVSTASLALSGSGPVSDG